MTTQVPPVDDLDWRPRALAYAEGLVGELGDPAWQQMLATVPRHLFVPSFWDLDEFNSPADLVCGEDPDQRETWLDAVYSDRFLVTQWAPGTGPGGIPIRIVTSSASEPSLVATMLDRLHVAGGHRVLEIGTGTGYNAALLCVRVGADLVTSIDVDPVLVDAAAHRLTAAGHRPQLHVGDGAAALPGDAAFDRIIATCSVRRIPPTWITQLATSGRLVAPLGFGGALAVLDKTSEVEVTGRIDASPVYFMPLRDAAERPLPQDFAPPVPATEPAAAHHGCSDVDPAELDGRDFQLWLALHHPALQLTHNYRDGAPTAAIVHTTRQRAIAALAPSSDGLWPVTQQNGRPWDTVESAWRAFVRTGRPGRGRLGLTARSDGHQHLWLDHPDSVYTWPVPERI